jgi:hypothetical protein
MSTIKVDTIKNTSNVEVFTCKAWVNFNGTGSPSIRASGNVTSVVDEATGVYTVNFTNAMTDTNYAVSFGARESSGGGNSFGRISSLVDTTYIRTVFVDEGGTATDALTCNVIVFR